MEVDKEPSTWTVDESVSCTQKGPNIVAGDFVQARVFF